MDQLLKEGLEYLDSASGMPSGRLQSASGSRPGTRGGSGFMVTCSVCLLLFIHLVWPQLGNSGICRSNR
ncbi:unnamed protein product [Protopolystoma xenopodis]|uniref:Uncharacterized protein n=1 Tax=Protopolystoma xenopodis TaxID=117903 RepID=A0A3S5AIS6_9PLAT|nr:unnamed protein product [Protopolystoma xenopodis]